MAFNSQVSGAQTTNKTAFLTYLSNSASRFGDAASRTGTRFLGNARLFVRAVQVARMVSTLMNMTDAQLAQLGISRSEIPQYAEELMKNE